MVELGRILYPGSTDIGLQAGLGKCLEEVILIFKKKLRSFKKKLSQTKNLDDA